MRTSLVVAVAVALTLGAYYPIVLHPNSTVLLAPGDLTSSARDYWATAYQHKTPFTLVRDRLVDVPDGRLAAPALQIANALQPLFVMATHGVAGYLGAFNVFMLLGVAASLAAMFVLLESLGLHPLAAFAGAVAFASSQWSVEQLLYGHVAFAQLWVFPLLLGALLWARTGDRRRALVPGFAYALSFYASSYLGLLCSLVVACFLLAAWWARGLRFDVRRLVFGSAAAIVGLLPAVLAPWIAPSPRLGLEHRTAEQLFGARLQDVVLPSTRHVLYGRAVDKLAGTHVGENVVFFGYATLALACVAVVMLLSRRLAFSLVLRFAVLAVPLGIVTALPPRASIFGVPVPDAARLIGGVVSWWRVFDRLAAVAGFGLVLLASAALDRLVRSGRRTHVAAAFFGAAVIVFEALPGAPVPTYSMRPDAATTWLRAHPGGAVAAYPSEPPKSTVAEWDHMYWSSYYLQVDHRHALFREPQRDQIPATPTGVASVLVGDLSDKQTPPILRAEGVRWVVVHRNIYAAVGSRVPRFAPGLAVAATFPGVQVLRVTAPPLDLPAFVKAHARDIAHRIALGDAVVAFGTGFYRAERYDGYSSGHWMQRVGKLLVHPGGQPLPYVVYDLRIRLFSSKVPRTVSVYENGRRAASFQVPTSEIVVDRRLRFPGTFDTLTFAATPDPFLLGGADRRSVSVFVESVEVIPVGLQLER